MQAAAPVAPGSVEAADAALTRYQALPEADRATLDAAHVAGGLPGPLPSAQAARGEAKRTEVARLRAEGERIQAAIDRAEAAKVVATADVARARVDADVRKLLTETQTQRETAARVDAERIEADAERAKTEAGGSQFFAVVRAFRGAGRLTEAQAETVLNTFRAGGLTRAEVALETALG